MIPIGNGQIALGDCLDVMRSIPSASVDMILCDLPYGTTECKWDSVIPFVPLWSEYWRIVKPNAAVVLTAAQPFTSALVMSQVNFFRTSWVWNKKQSGSFANAKYHPLKITEDILVFGKKQINYHPIMRAGKLRKKGGNIKSEIQIRLKENHTFNDQYYPTNIIELVNDRLSGKIHPTQKPVALFEYLIKTYTNVGDVVMDNCVGSGTTAIAAENTGRRWIGIERDPGYFGLACERIARHVIGVA